MNTEMKEEKMKCHCTADETSGWTTVKCCNICGLPIQSAIWDFSHALHSQLLLSREELEKARAEIIDLKNEIGALRFTMGSNGLNSYALPINMSTRKYQAPPQKGEGNGI